MPGGPINGVPWSALSSLVQPVGTIVSAARGDEVNPNDPVDFTGIIVPTVLQMAADVVGWFTGLTCLYDRHWTARQGIVTLPVCMFHVKKISTTHVVETSKKRVILYEQQDASAKDKADGMRPSVMRTVIDNAVKQPTTYNVEAIVPFQPFGRYFTESTKLVSDLMVSFSDIIGGTGAGYATAIIEGIFATVFSMLKSWTAVTTSLATLPGGNGAAYINMNSLEAMSDSCRTLCMKMWTGYDYKFVLMTGLSFEKNPNEDDVYRATFQLQEVPVLAVSPPDPVNKGAVSLSSRAKLVAFGQSAATSLFTKFTGVKDAAGDKSGMSLIQDGFLPGK